jgi:hypothetical protein
VKNTIHSTIFFPVFFAIIILTAGCSNNKSQPYQSTNDAAQETAEEIIIQPEPPSRAETVMKALSRAYPDIIGEAVYTDNDWAVPVYGKYFYYTDGKLLPEEIKDTAAEYSPLLFYTYQAGLPQWQMPDAETVTRLMNQRERSSANPLRRANNFYETLWQAHDREESGKQIRVITFFDRTVSVHSGIIPYVQAAEKQIASEAQSNDEVKQWIKNIASVSAWNWRNIANSSGRSFHSYGIAIDIQPKSLGGLETYWLWASQKNIDWWAVPYEKRFHPPEAVIKAFESYGFVWGGKWLFYDTMHFEYRPEVLLMNNMEIITAE